MCYSCFWTVKIFSIQDSIKSKSNSSIYWLIFLAFFPVLSLVICKSVYSFLKAYHLSQYYRQLGAVFFILRNVYFPSRRRRLPCVHLSYSSIDAKDVFELFTKGGAPVAHPMLLTVWMLTPPWYVSCDPPTKHRCIRHGFFIEILKNATVNVLSWMHCVFKKKSIMDQWSGSNSIYSVIIVTWL